MIFIIRKDNGKEDFSVDVAEKSSFLFYVAKHSQEDAGGRFYSYKIFLK